MNIFFEYVRSYCSISINGTFLKMWRKRVFKKSQTGGKLLCWSLTSQIPTFGKPSSVSPQGKKKTNEWYQKTDIKSLTGTDLQSHSSCFSGRLLSLPHYHHILVTKGHQELELRVHCYTVDGRAVQLAMALPHRSRPLQHLPKQRTPQWMSNSVLQIFHPHSLCLMTESVEVRTSE